MIGYMKAVAPVGAGFTASVQDVYCFHDVASAHAASSALVTVTAE